MWKRINLKKYEGIEQNIEKKRKENNKNNKWTIKAVKYNMHVTIKFNRPIENDQINGNGASSFKKKKIEQFTKTRIKKK